MIVKPTNRVFNAISFGVFCLEAPSTREIILSRKDLPGSEVILTFSQSLTTVVPPVTEEKSPPASLVTGADSPVIADSSTEAIPSITSPSLGINSFVLTITTSPFFSSEAFTSFSSPLSKSKCAMVSFFVFFKDSACALPRPSATDSAKFANKTVINRITATKPLYTLRVLSSPNTVGKMVRTSAMKNPISTTNITGFFIIYLGLSF